MKKTISPWRIKNDPTKKDLRNAAMRCIVFSTMCIITFLVAFIHPVLCIIAVAMAFFFTPILLEYLAQEKN